LEAQQPSLYDSPNMPEQPLPEYSLGITPTQRPMRHSLGITNMGPNLGAEMPGFDAPSLQTPEQEPSAFARSRGQILPQPGDFDEYASPSPQEQPEFRDQPQLSAFQQARGRILPQPWDFNSGGKVEIPELDAQAPAQPEAQMQAPRLADMDFSSEATADPQRRRNLYTALAQFTAGMGNIGGTPTATTVPAYMQQMDKQDDNKIDQANKMEDFALRRMIRQTEQEKAKALAEKTKRDAVKNKEAEDPNSLESQVANKLLRAYYSKYASPDFALPENMPAAAIYKFLPGLSNIVRGEMMGQFGLQQTQIKGDQAIIQQENKLAAEERLAKLKSDYDLLKNDNTVQGQIEKTRIVGEINKELTDMKGKYSVDVANIGAKSREKTAQIGAGAKIGATKIAQAGADKRAATRVNKADQYRNYKEVKGAASEYKKDAIVRNYLTIAGQRKKLEQNLKNPTAIGDVSSIFGYMKGLDPTSAVRPGEIDLVNQAQSIKDRILNIDDRVLRGESLTPQLRKQIYDDVKQLESLAADNVKYLNDTVRAVSKEGGWSPESFLIKFGGQPGGGISVGGPSAAPQGPAKIKVYKPGGAK
jgi:hypothetical protein